MQTELTPEQQRKAILKVSWRLLPLIVASYLVAYIDRTNVSFASLTMNKDLGLTAYIYGWGAGIFFISYALFEVPSNMILQKTSARLWIARIMITWGIISGMMALAQGPVSFLVLRFLLGIAEAGFFPGIIFYFTYWFPVSVRGRVISILYCAIPVSNALASVMSGAILEMNGIWGLHGWQWVFIIEAIPAVLLAFVVLKMMTERPRDAEWLQPAERDWLEGELAAERAGIERMGTLSLRQSLTDSRVLALALIYFTGVTASYGVVFFLPHIIKAIGNLTNFQTGLVTAIPYIIGTLGLLAWGYSSDRKKERRWHLITSTGTAAIGLFGVGAFVHVGNPVMAVVFMCVATVGIYGSRPSFWPMPSLFLTGAAAATGMAFINSIGNVGGYVGPLLVGWIKDSTPGGGFQYALYFLGSCALVSTIAALVFTRATAPVMHAEKRAKSQAAKQLAAE